MITESEENYIKAIFKIAEKEKKAVSTTAIAAHLETSPASVTDMIKKLADKGLVDYERYYGVTLTAYGIREATQLIRRHRLWEVFLVEKLRFGWHQVHEIAEQLEHVHSEEMVARLDAYLDYPRYDPHGDPIPNSDGKFTLRTQEPLSALLPGQQGIVLGVKEHDTPFLSYLNQMGIRLGTEIKILEKTQFDLSLRAMVDKKKEMTFTHAVSQLLLMKING
jgi:DtxR family Mn-dependent transcriptional regulator